MWWVGGCGCGDVLARDATVLGTESPACLNCACGKIIVVLPAGISLIIVSQVLSRHSTKPNAKGTKGAQILFHTNTHRHTPTGGSSVTISFFSHTATLAMLRSTIFLYPNCRREGSYSILVSVCVRQSLH